MSGSYFTWDEIQTQNPGIIEVVNMYSSYNDPVYKICIYKDKFIFFHLGRSDGTYVPEPQDYNENFFVFEKEKWSKVEFLV